MSTTLQKKDPSSKSVHIDGKVSLAQVNKACRALAAHREKSKGATIDLPLDGDESDEGIGSRVDPADTVWLQLTIKSLNPNAPAKPIRITLPHSIWPKSASICLLSADPQREYKDLMVAEKITQVQRVVGVSKLKGKFAPFEARRALMSEHDLFLADDRIVPMLPKLLGKKWMSERKTPIPIRIAKGKSHRAKQQVELAQASTFFHRNKGTCSSIRMGTLRSLTAEQLGENVAAALPLIIGKHVKGGWENVQSIDIKTGTSVALPVWNCKVSERWTGLPENVSDSESEEAEEAEKHHTATDAKHPGNPKRNTKTRSSISHATSKAKGGVKA